LRLGGGIVYAQVCAWRARLQHDSGNSVSQELLLNGIE
jgi:hypothetical protein